MNKLKSVIKEHHNWNELNIYIDRIETYIDTDFSNALENAKALLESIGKEICNKNHVELDKSPTLNKILKRCFTSMGYGNSDIVNQVSTALATIAQQVGELRNKIGTVSHGKTLEEIEHRNNKIDTLTRDFLIDSIETICIFIIRNYESNNIKKLSKNPEEIDYFEAEDFNNFWDDSFGNFEMGSYSYTASEILFYVDKPVYIDEYNTFKNNGN